MWSILRRHGVRMPGKNFVLILGKVFVRILGKTLVKHRQAATSLGGAPAPALPPAPAATTSSGDTSARNSRKAGRVTDGAIGIPRPSKFLMKFSAEKELGADSTHRKFGLLRKPSSVSLSSSHLQDVWLQMARS